MQIHTVALPQMPLSPEAHAHMGDGPYKVAAALAALLVLFTVAF